MNGMTGEQAATMIKHLESLVGHQAAPPAAAANVQTPLMQTPVMPAQVMPAMMMQPQMQPMPTAAMQTFVPQMQGPAPTGISVPITCIMPDGSELAVRLHFGPEYAANLQGFVQMIAQAYGPMLKTYRPRQQFMNGYGGGYGGGFGGGYRGGFNGYRGRRY